MPSNLTIEGNTTVIWTNNDTVIHTVTSGNPTKRATALFNSSYIGANQKYSHTFTIVGDFNYFCSIHPFMIGKISVVKEIKPIVTILAPNELPNRMNVTIANGSSFPNNGKFFIPSEISIAANGTVSWTNNDTTVHTVTSGKPRQGPSVYFDSGLLNQGAEFNHTFTNGGIYDYYSTLNPFMVGKVIVGFSAYNLQVAGRTYPVSFQITGNGNQIQKISLTNNPLLEIRMSSASPGNLTIVLPRNILDKVDQNGNDDAFGVVGNSAIGFNETSRTNVSRTVTIQFDKGLNYIQILGSKSAGPSSTVVNTTVLSTDKSQPSTYQYENKQFGVIMDLPQHFGVYETGTTLFIYPGFTNDYMHYDKQSNIQLEIKKITVPFKDWAQSRVQSSSKVIKGIISGNPSFSTVSTDGREIVYIGDKKIIRYLQYPIPLNLIIQISLMMPRES